MDVDIQVASADSTADLHGLQSWLHRDDDLSGAVRALTTPPRPGDLGSGVDQALIAAVTSAATAKALARCVICWIQHRGTRIDVKLTAANGRKIEINGSDVQRMSPAEIRALVQQAGLLLPDSELLPDPDEDG
jgi:hypothetical protein